MERGANAVPRVVLVPFPAHGHVTPILQLGSALTARGVAGTVVLPDFLLHARFAPAAADIELLTIPSEINSTADADGAPHFAAMVEAMEKSMPAHLDRFLRSNVADGIKCVVVDVLAAWAIPVAERLGITTVGFWPGMAATYRVIAAIPELLHQGLISKTGLPVFEEERTVIAGDGVELSSSRDLPWLVGDAASQSLRFAFWIRTLHRTANIQSILINSFPNEPHPLSDPDPDSDPPRLFPIAPLLRPPPASCCCSGIVEWLDQHEPGSVIYVSFGTWVGPVGPEAVEELALGLEATGRPFLWALKKEPAWRAGLPDRFELRTGRRGRVVEWAPQEQVLQHAAVGCFVTHCGWNSTLEAIRHGVPMVCFPISGDQGINCRYIVEVWRVGVRLGAARRAAVEDCVERVMAAGGEEGEGLKERIRCLRIALLGKGTTAAVANLQRFVSAIKQY